MPDDPKIALSDLIGAVRSELETAAVNAAGQALQFEVQDIELDVEVTTTGTAGASGGVKVWVLNIGARGSRSKGSTQRVKVKLGPVGPGGTRYKVSDTTSKSVRRK